MDIEILGHNMQVTEDINTYVRKKLERLDRYLPNISDVRVELTHEHARRGDDLMTAQITVRHRRGAILRSQETTQGDVETVMNAAVEKMHRQIERFKGRRSRKGRGKFAATMDEINLAEVIPGFPVDGELMDDEEDEIVDVVVRRKDIAVTTMDEDEAIQQMELLGHTFFVFFNERLGALNIVYKRRAGGYGVLVPQLG